MNYFRYQYQGSMGPIWSLFSDLEGVAEEARETAKGKNRCEFGHSVDIVKSAMNGNFANTAKDFSLRNYEYACQRTETVEWYAKNEKILSIVDTDEEEDGRVGYKEISSNKIKFVEDAYKIMEDNEAFEEYMTELLELRSVYIVELGIDPLELLRNALRGVPSAIKEMKGLKDKRLSEVFLNLCESGSKRFLQVRLDSCLG